jgi:predicted transcriptional regulator
VLVLHHLGKDASKGARGHSSLKDKTDIEVIVTAAEIRTDTFRRTTIKLDTTKNRNYDSAEISLVLTRPNETLVAPVIIGKDQTGGVRSQLQPPEVALAEALQDNATNCNLSATEALAGTQPLADSVNVSRQAALDTLKGMETKGYVRRDTSGRAHQWALTEKGYKAICNLSASKQMEATLSASNPQHPIGAGRLHMGDNRPTVIEELLEQARQDDAIDEPGAEVTDKALATVLAIVSE